MKKFLQKGVALICVLANMVGLAACGGGETPQEPTGEHTHYGGTATCENKAVCEGCGESYGEYGDHDYVYSICSVCWKNEGSDGMEYQLNADGQSYTLTASSYCTDSYIAIPNYYKEKPVTAIGDYAFYHSTNIVSIEISKSITSIGKGALSAGLALEEITVHNDNPAFKSFGGNLYSKDGKTFVQYATGKDESSLTLPDGVEYISDHAFERAKLREIVLPEGVKTIGDYAFAWSNINTVALPSSLESLGVDLYRFSKVDTTDADGLSFYGNRVNTRLALMGVDKDISSCEIPQNTKIINGFAFAGVEKLTSISVSSANEYYKEVDGNVYSKDGKTLVRYAPGKTAETFAIPSGVTKIQQGAFAGLNNSLTAVEIPASVTEIEKDAFKDCKGLTVYLAESSSLKAWAENDDASDTRIVYGYSASDNVVTAYQTYYTKNSTAYITAPTVKGETKLEKVSYRMLGKENYTELSSKAEGYKLVTSKEGWANILYQTEGDKFIKIAVCIRNASLFQDFEDDDIYNGGSNYYSHPQGGNGYWDLDGEWEMVELSNNNHGMRLYSTGGGWEGFIWDEMIMLPKTYTAIVVRVYSSAIVEDFKAWFSMDESGRRGQDLQASIPQGWSTVTFTLQPFSCMKSFCFHKTSLYPTIVVDDIYFQ